LFLERPATGFDNFIGLPRLGGGVGVEVGVGVGGGVRSTYNKVVMCLIQKKL